MEFEKYHVHGLRPEPVNAIDDETLLGLIAFYSGLKELCGHRFANYLQSVLAHEYERRHSDGAIERCSHEMPLLHPHELARVRSWITLQTYESRSDGPLWDELLNAIDVQTQYHMDQYTALLATR